MFSFRTDTPPCLAVSFDITDVPIFAQREQPVEITQSEH
jgi:hypothetical protein